MTRLLKYSCARPVVFGPSPSQEKNFGPGPVPVKNKDSFDMERARILIDGGTTKCKIIIESNQRVD